jgi:hypothetical protein
MSEYVIVRRGRYLADGFDADAEWTDDPRRALRFITREGAYAWRRHLEGDPLGEKTIVRVRSSAAAEPSESR